METLKNVLIMLGAILIPLITLAVGLSGGYAEGRAAMVGQALLLLLAAGFAFKKKFLAMGLYLAGILFVATMYPKIEAFSSYSREGSTLGQLSELRSSLAGMKTADGTSPDAILKVTTPLRLKNGHKDTSAIYTVRLPDEAYLFPPEIPAGETLRVTLKQEGADWEQDYAWTRENKWPLLLYPGGTYIYEIRRENPARLVSSGTVKVPVPPGFNVDSGEYAYDQAHGWIFINCTHSGRQHVIPWWTW